ncbi:MAG TPA: type II CAAX endopeptidase family protein [Clostridia bacterium]|nr:type II CAAX endopeptidase family protein [Clostridia bacterium]
MEQKKTTWRDAAKRFLSTDGAYQKQIASYGKTDAILALALYVMMLIAYYGIGVLQIKRNLYLGIPVNLALILFCVALALLRRQGLSSIGITQRNLGRSTLAGALSGVVLSFLMNVLPSILAGRKVIPFGLALYNVFYYFVVIGLSEEIIFRGYIQTRINGLIKDDFLAMLIVGVLFYFMHLPYQMPVNGMQFNVLQLAVFVVLHMIHNILYRKFNSLAGPTLLHGLLDWGGKLFR